MTAEPRGERELRRSENGERATPSASTSAILPEDSNGSLNEAREVWNPGPVLLLEFLAAFGLASPPRGNGCVKNYVGESP